MQGCFTKSGMENVDLKMDIMGDLLSVCTLRTSDELMLWLAKQFPFFSNQSVSFFHPSIQTKEEELQQAGDGDPKRVLLLASQ